MRAAMFLGHLTARREFGRHGADHELLAVLHLGMLTVRGSTIDPALLAASVGLDTGPVNLRPVGQRTSLGRFNDQQCLTSPSVLAVQRVGYRWTSRKSAALRAAASSPAIPPMTGWPSLPPASLPPSAIPRPCGGDTTRAGGQWGLASGPEGRDGGRRMGPVARWEFGASAERAARSLRFPQPFGTACQPLWQHTALRAVERSFTVVHPFHPPLALGRVRLPAFGTLFPALRTLDSSAARLGRGTWMPQGPVARHFPSCPCEL
jgi:hypothetical protein